MTEHPYLQSRIVRIFRTRSYLNAYDDEGTVYQGCLRPGGKPLRVAVDLEDGEYPPEVVLRRLTVSGAYVGALSVVGEASQAECEKYATANPAVCPVPIADVHVVDMRTRHAVDVEEPAGTAGLVLSPSGAAAWLVPQAGGGSALETFELHIRVRETLGGTTTTVTTPTVTTPPGPAPTVDAGFGAGHSQSGVHPCAFRYCVL